MCRCFAILARRPLAPPTRDALLYPYYVEPPYPAPPVNALVTRRFKYIETRGRADIVYDEVLDPNERVNAIGDLDGGTVTKLKQRLADLHSAALSPGFEPLRLDQLKAIAR